MKKITLIACMAMLVPILCRAQDSTATINTTWRGYANDTNLTYQQIVTICDSQFDAAGYPPTDGDSTAAEELDGSPYMAYKMWKDFWAFRTDAATGKLHNFAEDARTALTSGWPPNNCAGTSSLQSGIETTMPGTPAGWQFIGPQHITLAPTSKPEIEGNTLHQHLGEVNDIVVNKDNPSEIYATDSWGGLWKTTNADLAPNNTWTCLSDNLSLLSGIGITKLYVDFSSTPHKLYCLAGEPFAACFQNDPRTVGIFYSLDDGTTFHQMDISGIVNLKNNPILDMQYWPGNATSSNKYLFITTRFDVYRLDITDPTSVSGTIMYDVSGKIPTDDPKGRFPGFNHICFSQSDPTIMYVSTNSNLGSGGFPTSAALYKVNSCTTCSSCALTNIPFTEKDYLLGWGSFGDAVHAGTFITSKNNSATGIVLPYWKYNTDHYMFCGLPDPTTLGLTAADYPLPTQSFEANVDGSYIDNVTYKISFKITLPPKTEIDVVLKDVNKDHNGNQPDWGTGTTPTASTEYPTNFDVGVGYVASGGSPTIGHYVNDGSTTVTRTYTDVVVTATHFVDRLEFGVFELPGYNFTAGDQFELYGVKVMESFEDNVFNLRTRSSEPGYLYCTSYVNNLAGTVCKIHDLGTSFPITEYPYPSQIPYYSLDQYKLPFELSTVNPDIIYEYANQSVDYMHYKLDMSTGITTPGIPNSTSSGAPNNPIHCDGRSMVLLPNATNTDDIMYMGEDGGIALGSFDGSWTDLNGTGMKTSWAFDIGSSIHTGNVGIAATDNSIMVSNPSDFSNWQLYSVGDGGQIKYGKRYLTRNLQFEGSSNSSGFASLDVYNRNSATDPVINNYPHQDYILDMDVSIPTLGKLVTTNNNEYFGTGYRGGGNNIYDISIQSGSGTSSSPYTLQFNDLTTDATYTLHGEGVQAVAPDPIDPQYIIAYTHVASWDQGHFASTKDATSATPTWKVVSNSPKYNPNATGWDALICMAVDSRSPTSNKRVWVGAANYRGTGDVNRVFQSKDGGDTWSDMSKGLPDGPVTALAYDEQSHYLFAGTDQGVYAYNVDDSNNTSNQWQCFSLNLPNSFVTGLDINRCTGKIYVSTYGRGAYEAELPPDPNNNGNVNPNDNSDVDYISSNTTWIQDRDEMRSVYVPSNVTLTIQNCTINMGRDKTITVAPGGKLIVDNAIITNTCGFMWYGINALGNVNQPQTAATQGWVILKNNSILENARFAVNNWNGANLATAGGVIQATNSKFLNNRHSVSFASYHNWGNNHLYPNRSYFIEDDFQLDDAYRGDPVNYPFYAMAELWDVEGVTFSGCSFINNNTNDHNRGVGIISYNAGYTVGPHCIAFSLDGNCTGVRNTFHGFVDGINLSGDLHYNPTVTIDQSDFDACSVGVYVQSVNNVHTIRSTFDIGTGGWVYYFTGDNYDCHQNIGIYVKNTNQFTIEENTFNGIPNTSFSDWTNFGVVAENTVDNKIKDENQLDNTIYRCNFNSLNYGCYAYGNNGNGVKSTSITYGLSIVCNSFANNNTDIYADPAGSSYALRPVQGTATSAPDGNSYNSLGHITNVGSNDIVFYHNNSQGNVVGSGYVKINPSTNTNSCESTLAHHPGAGIAKLGLSTQTGLKAMYRSAKQQLTTETGQYSSLIDGGNTNSLVNFIQTTQDPNNLYNTLNSISPYLSQTALLALSNTSIMPRNNYLSILDANPEDLRDDNFLNTLSLSSNYPLSQNDISNLQSIANTNTQRSSLETSIYELHSQQSQTLNLLLMDMRTDNDVADSTGTVFDNDSTSMYYLVDTNSYYCYLDTAKEFLKGVGSPWAEYALAGYYNSFDPHDTSGLTDTALAHAFGYYDQTDTPGLDEYNSYSVVYSVLKSMQNSGDTIWTMDSTELSQLNSIARFTSSNKGSVVADVIANNSNPNPLLPPVRKMCVFISTGGKQGRSLPGNNDPISPANDLRADCSLSAYPNPAKNSVIFSYAVPKTTGKMELSVTNSIGETVKQFLISDTKGSIHWQTSDIPSGVYIYVLKDGSGAIGRGKLVINK